MAQEVKLSNGLLAIVDDDDYAWVKFHKWHYHSAGYAVTHIDGRSKPYMHRLILAATSGQTVDHINGDKLDNRKGNLRIVSASQNTANSKKKMVDKVSSIYKGVSYDKRRGAWFARIRKDGVSQYLGSYKLEMEAAKAYNSRAIEIFGEFARLNEFPSEDVGRGETAGDSELLTYLLSLSGMAKDELLAQYLKEAVSH